MAQYIGSETPLAAGGTYTSRWVTADIADKICGSIFTDQAGTIYIEQSGDQDHADLSASYSISANNGEGFVEELLLPFIRLRLTNTSGSDQTVLRLFSRFKFGDMP